MSKYTGTLRDVILCQIDNTNIEFLFGYVVEHISIKFACHDWFASSYITKIKKVDDYFVVTTANSIYRIPTYKTMVVPMAAVDNIRMGATPEKALRIINGSFGQTLH